MADSEKASPLNQDHTLLEAEAAAPRVTITKPRFNTPEKIAKYERNVRKLEEADRQRSQPLEYNPDQHIDRPRCSLKIAGASELSLSLETYVLNVTITYHASTDSESKPIVLNTLNTALATRSPQERYFPLYTSRSLDYESRVPYRQTNIPCLRKPQDYNPKFPITAEKGFLELAPGGEYTAAVKFETAAWRRYLEVGKRYFLLYTGETLPRGGGLVRYWRYGTFESLKSESCDYDDDKAEDGIVLPRSNVIEITVVE
ncbi:MAG: hypothetical protein M1836_005779 [Candelina mexicana]|nr:MAG: hypothetical protein M1836_005779 [Candelina mexicana]